MSDNIISNWNHNNVGNAYPFKQYVNEENNSFWPALFYEHVHMYEHEVYLSSVPFMRNSTNWQRKNTFEKFSPFFFFQRRNTVVLGRFKNIFLPKCVYKKIWKSFQLLDSVRFRGLLKPLCVPTVNYMLFCYASREIHPCMRCDYASFSMALPSERMCMCKQNDCCLWSCSCWIPVGRERIPYIYSFAWRLTVE